jgi:hypothetical protein
MVEIVHLGPRQRPLRGEYFVLIQRRRRGCTGITQAPEGGLTLKIQAPFFEEELAGLKRKPEAGGAKMLYVRDWLRVP